MPRKQWISVKCGLSRDPKHRLAMGECVWLFLHMLDIADWETGTIRQWRDEDASEDLQMNVRTLREQRRKLEGEGYITCVQKQYGQNIIIHNWTNPREYNGNVYNKRQGYVETPPSENSQGYTQGYTQGDSQDVTPTLDSNTKESLSEEEKAEILRNSDPAFSILAGQKVDEDAQKKRQLIQEALTAFETDMKCPGNWSWDGTGSNDKDWTYLREFVVQKYSENKGCFKAYHNWSKEQFARGAMSVLAIKRNPENFPASWSSFLASNAMYGKKTSTVSKTDDNNVPMSY